jgi:hypothetical protein
VLCPDTASADYGVREGLCRITAVVFGRLLMMRTSSGWNLVFGVGDDPERAEVLAGVGDWKTPY